MKIIGLSAQNFKIIKSMDVNIPEDKDIIEIVGDNGSGKSSFLDSVETALGGARHTAFEAISNGEEECILEVRLKDDRLGKLKVIKTLKKGKKDTLVIQNLDNPKQVFNSPQSVLDGFIGTLSFDPAVFYNMTQEMQYDTLKDMLGLEEIDELNIANDKDFKERTTINRVMKQKASQLIGIGEIGEEIKLVDINKLVNKLQKINEQNAKIDIEFVAHENLKTQLKERHKKIIELEKEIDRLKVEVLKIDGELILFKDIKKTDVTIYRKEIKDAELNNQNYHEQQNNIEKRNELVNEVNILTKDSDKLTASMEKRKEKKAKILADTKMPIEGLTFENKIIRYNEVAISECSTAEKIRISFGIAVALNPTLKVVFIREGALLDKSSRALIIELAKEKGYDIWIEMLESGIKGKDVMTVIIEKGVIEK